MTEWEYEKKIDQLKSEKRIMGWIIYVLLGLIAIMWLHFVLHVPLGSNCQPGDTLPCSF